MTDALSFTDRLVNLFSLSENSTYLTASNTFNTSLQIISNFTTISPIEFGSSFTPVITSEATTTLTIPSSTRETTSLGNVTDHSLFRRISADVTFRVFYSFALILLTILGIVGNLHVLIGILGNPMLRCCREITNVPVFNLAIADLVMLILGSFPAIFATILGKSPLDSLSCRIQGSVLFASFQASVYTAAIISIERLINLKWSFFYPDFIQKESLITGCLISWIPGFIAGIYLTADPGWINHDSNAGICQIDWNSGSPNPITWSILTFVLLFLVPGILTLLLNFVTLAILIMKRTKKLAQRPQVPAPPRPRFRVRDDEYFMARKTFSPEFFIPPSAGVMNQLKTVISPRATATVPGTATAAQPAGSVENELFTRVNAGALRPPNAFGSMNPVGEADESEFCETIDSAEAARNQNNYDAESKEITTSLLSVVITLLLFIIPTLILNILKLVSEDAAALPSWMTTSATLLLFLRSFITPIIYFYSRTDFREAFIHSYDHISCCPCDDD